MTDDLAIIDEHRKAVGLCTVAETLRLAASGVRVLDPYSVLFSAGVTFGPDVTLFPNVLVYCDASSSVQVGAGTTMYQGTVIQASSGGIVRIGNRCEMGPGGVQVKANAPGSEIVIGDDARLLNGCEVVGNSVISDGCQLIGQISAQSVRLEGGKGGHQWPEPDERGAVLKGAGLARGIVLGAGQVMNLQPSFASVPREPQSAYHPKPNAACQQGGPR